DGSDAAGKPLATLALATNDVQFAERAMPHVLSIIADDASIRDLTLSLVARGRLAIPAEHLVALLMHETAPRHSAMSSGATSYDNESLRRAILHPPSEACDALIRVLPSAKGSAFYSARAAIVQIGLEAVPRLVMCSRSADTAFARACLDILADIGK